MQLNVYCFNLLCVHLCKNVWEWFAMVSNNIKIVKSSGSVKSPDDGLNRFNSTGSPMTPHVVDDTECRLSDSCWWRIFRGTRTTRFPLLIGSLQLDFSLISHNRATNYDSRSDKVTMPCGRISEQTHKRLNHESAPKHQNKFNH